MIGREGEIVCPEPLLWYEIHQRLLKAAPGEVTRIPKPPQPLILSGWWASTNLQKLIRWRETVEWAERWRFTHLIGELPDERLHKVDPIEFLLPLLSLNPYPNRSYETRQKPTLEEENTALNRLSLNWGEIAGSIAIHCQPLRFTGAKRRRLLVRADADNDFKPPWGEWNSITAGASTHFKHFRRAVNDAIKPHEVDHIDVVHRKL